MERTFDWADLMSIAVREATRMGLPYEDAEDAAQEAVLRAWQKRRQCRDESASSWVASIGRREAYRLAAKRREVPIDPAVWPEPSPGVDQADARIDIRRALGTLAPADRLVLLLRHERDLAHSDIAQIIGSREATSAIRLHRAHKRLRRLVQSTDAHEPEGG
jgi:RNA polymerase sigma factor (sigma-70 family)